MSTTSTIDSASAFFSKKCRITGDEFFDIRAWVRQTRDINPDSARLDERRRLFEIDTTDDFCIKICKMDLMRDNCWLNGYVVIPEDRFCLHEIVSETDYDEFQCRVGIRHVELTFGDGRGMFGWDHGHLYDANLYQPAAYQTDRKISGPVQVLDEAIEMTRLLRTKEEEMRLEKKKAQTRAFYQELISKALDPKRVAVWIKGGVEL